MNRSKFKLLTVIVLTSLLFVGCNSGGKESKAQESSVQENQQVENAGEPINTTVENGNRLSNEALKSYLPEVFGGLNKSGNPVIATSDPDKRDGGISKTLDESYSGSEGRIHLHIRDSADDQAYINSIQKGMSYRDFPFSKTTRNDKGWYITKSFEFRAAAGEDTLVTSRTVSLRNPRFIVEMKYSPPLGDEPPSFDYLMDQLNQSYLPDLLELDIPQGEVIAKVAPKRTLNCDELLPAEQVADFCDVSGIKANATSFEGDDNCNRKYSSSGSFDGLAFLVSHYEEVGPAGSAVTMKVNDTSMDTKQVNNLGDDAVVVTVGEDAYLTVAHETFLVELRAFPKTFCGTEENLYELANQVLEKLPD